MRLLTLLALILAAGCDVPSRGHPDVHSRAHGALLDSLRAVPTCSPRDYRTDRAFHECRYQRAADRLAAVRQSEYGALDGAPLYPGHLARHRAEVALAALDAGRTAEARPLVGEAREALAAARAERGDDAAYWSEAAEAVAVVEGRLALLAGDRPGARRRLLASGRALAAPTQLSFGPNVTLARDLLAAGDTAGVRAYFAVLDATWSYGAEKVAAWRAALDRGAAPDFGPNLVY